MMLGPVMLDLRGVALDEEEIELIQHPAVGGVILFTRNFRTPLQLRTLVQTIRKYRPGILIAVDQEGGRVQRFRDHFTKLPAPAKFGELYDQNPQLAKICAETAGWMMAAELRQFDIDFSFAPVLDLNYGRSAVIGNRAFHADPGVTGELAGAFIRGMHRAGMQAVGKHFPGHGYVEADSHEALPIDTRTLKQIKEKDLVPFEMLIQKNLLGGVMPAHIIYPKIDKEAAGFSKKWLQTILRSEMKFLGVVFSDSLTMEGAEYAGGYDERAEKALMAGCDMVLVCNNRLATYTMLDALKSFSRPDLPQLLQTMRGEGGEGLLSLAMEPAWQEGVSLLKDL